MKKFSFLFVLLSVFISSYAEDRLIVDNTQIVSGESAYIVVKMDFDENHDYVSYQFNVELPNGISLIEKTSGQARFELPSNQPTDIFTIKDFPMSNGILKVASNPSTVIGDHEGTLVYIPVEAEAGLTNETVLNGKLSGVVFAHANATTANLADVNFTITIADQVVLDENSEIAPLATSGNVNVKVKRTINANEWSTICLPFDMTKEQIESSFGNDVQLAFFTGYNAEKEGNDITNITINIEGIELTDGFYGNYPYLIKTSNNITEFTLTATIAPDEVMESISQGSGPKKRTGKLIGTYQAKTTVPENDLFLSENKFWYSKGSTKMKAFRAYFELDDVLSEAKNANARISFNFEDDTTGITEVHGSNKGAEGTYDLQGRKIEEPVKGLYIVNGRKVVKK